MQPRVEFRVHFVAFKVGSKVNNSQGESTMWTYCVHIFSLSLCIFPNVGLQCVLVSRETSNWLTCNFKNFLHQPLAPVTTQGLK